MLNFSLEMDRVMVTVAFWFSTTLHKHLLPTYELMKNIYARS